MAITRVRPSPVPDATTGVIAAADQLDGAVSYCQFLDDKGGAHMIMSPTTNSDYYLREDANSQPASYYWGSGNGRIKTSTDNTGNQRYALTINTTTSGTNQLFNFAPTSCFVTLEWQFCYQPSSTTERLSDNWPYKLRYYIQGSSYASEYVAVAYTKDTVNDNGQLADQYNQTGGDTDLARVIWGKRFFRWPSDIWTIRFGIEMNAHDYTHSRSAQYITALGGSPAQTGYNQCIVHAHIIPEPATGAPTMYTTPTMPTYPAS